MLFESNAGFQNVAVFSNALQTVCMYLCDSYFRIVSCSVPINHSLFHLVKKIYIFFSIEIHSSHDKCTRFNFAFNFLQYDYDLSNHLPALNLLGVGFHITSHTSISLTFSLGGQKSNRNSIYSFDSSHV